MRIMPRIWPSIVLSRFKASWFCILVSFYPPPRGVGYLILRQPIAIVKVKTLEKHENRGYSNKNERM
jgi:hypothetical protein